MNHQVKLYPLLLEQFSMPEDFVLTLATTQITEMSGAYQEKLLQAFPPDLCNTNSEKTAFAHPLYQAEQRDSRFRGTVAYLGRHKRLDFLCLILSDPLKAADREAVMQQAIRVAQLEHPSFPRLYDVVLDNSTVWTYQEYRGERPLEWRLLDQWRDETS